MQAHSEISVLHLTNDKLNCSGLLLLSTRFSARRGMDGKLTGEIAITVSRTTLPMRDKKN